MKVKKPGMGLASVFLALGLAVLFTGREVRGQVPAKAIDDFVAGQMKQQKIPGLALAVLRNGEIVLSRGYGKSNVELGVPVSPETVFQSGSVGKQFTATLTMMLVEEGRLELDAPIAKYLPELPKSWNGVTVRHLLTHTAGISPKFYEKVNLRLDYSEDDILKLMSANPLDFTPGERFEYSNEGYVLLGILIHKVTGKFYGDLLAERIFRPLGMNTARIINEADIIPNRSAGYRLVNGELKNQEWVSPFFNSTADGSLYLTILDFARWDAALYTERVLKKASLDRMWTPVKTRDGKPSGYGFGWELSTVNGHRSVGHIGEWQGFTACIDRYPEDGLTIVILTNLGECKIKPISDGVAGLVNPALAVPSGPKP